MSKLEVYIIVFVVGECTFGWLHNKLPPGDIKDAMNLVLPRHYK